MRKKVILALFLFLLILFLAPFHEAGFHELARNHTDHLMSLTSDTHETVPHNHLTHIELSHEEFFYHTDFSDPYGIRFPSGTVYQTFFTVPIKYSFTFWHPPKNA
jgi:hypothetical protein